MMKGFVCKQLIAIKFKCNILPNKTWAIKNYVTVNKEKPKKDLKTDAILMMQQTESLEMVATRYENWRYLWASKAIKQTACHKHKDTEKRLKRSV